MQSHAFALRIRPAVAAIAARHGARVAVAEVPPGPPVLQTLVAEVYGPDRATRQRLAERMRALFLGTPAVVDVDWYVESPHPKEVLVVDKEKAALHGITADSVARTLHIALSGESIGRLHVPDEPGGRRHRGGPASDAAPELADLLAVQLPDGRGRRCRSASSSACTSTEEDQSIHHKNLSPVVYVTGDVAGRAGSPAYAILQMNKAVAASGSEPVAVYNSTQPPSDAATGHQVGRRVAHHARGVPGSRTRICGGAAPHLRAGRGLVPVLPHAAGRHGADSPSPWWAFSRRMRRWERFSPRRR